jgi:nicotinate-nucleotide--dimethylbenzimidazole phosphoribosyltransferase
MGQYNNVLKNIKPAYEESKVKAAERLDSLVKPIGSLGKLEEIAIKLSGITGNVKNELKKKCTIIMAADNGVVEEGVSSSPQYVTTVQSINFCKGLTGVSVLSRHAGAEIRVIDIGINNDIEYPGLINRKIRKGTSNMAVGPAMSKDEAVQAIEIGIEAVGQLVGEGFNLLGTGEMGIGNTSTSSAMVMSFLNCSADKAIGKGAGLTEEGLLKKKNVIKRALEINCPNSDDPLDVLSKVGGFDIAGLVGCFLGAAYYRVPIVIDGFISAVAALTAYRINPRVKDFMFSSHCSGEPGYELAVQEIGLEPMLNLDMRLGEGSGCPLAFNIIEAAEEIICHMATFEEASIADDFLIDIRK